MHTVELAVPVQDGGTAVVIKASISNNTVTIAHGAGPTTGKVFVVGF